MWKGTYNLACFQPLLADPANGEVMEMNYPAEWSSWMLCRTRSCTQQCLLPITGWAKTRTAPSTAWVSSIDTSASDDLKSCSVMCDITTWLIFVRLYYIRLNFNLRQAACDSLKPFKGTYVLQLGCIIAYLLGWFVLSFKTLVRATKRRKPKLHILHHTQGRPSSSAIRVP